MVDNLNLRIVDVGRVSVGAGMKPIAGMRFFLAGIVLLAYLIDIPGTVDSSVVTWTAIAAYLFYSFIAFIAAGRLSVFSGDRHMHWLDLAWYSLLTAVTDPLTSGIFLFFLFAILSASFGHGRREGIYVTLGCTLIYSSTVALSTFEDSAELEWTSLFLRTFFLLSLGCLIAQWGGSELALKKRLALLGEINQISNPRFGVEQAIALVLRKLCEFFKADTCIVISHDPESNIYLMREASALSENFDIAEQSLPMETANLLLPFNSGQIINFNRINKAFSFSGNGCAIHDPETGKWTMPGEEACAAIADMLNAQSFISAPLQSTRDAGRIYIISNNVAYRLDDTLFLAQAVDQAFRLIEHVRTLDRLASGAAGQERQRIVGDLHDTTIQPYIGLKLGLEALQAQAGSDNPLNRPIEGLLKMTGEVISDLRRYVDNLKNHQVLPGNLLVSSIREKADKFLAYYGVDVDVHTHGDIYVSDRLAAEVLQIVSEAFSNIRKHTRARQCTVTLSCRNGMFRLTIDNPFDGSALETSIPRSISRRVTALGGQMDMQYDRDGHTILDVKIPT